MLSLITAVSCNMQKPIFNEFHFLQRRKQSCRSQGVGGPLLRELMTTNVRAVTRQELWDILESSTSQLNLGVLVLEAATCKFILTVLAVVVIPVKAEDPEHGALPQTTVNTA